MKNLQEKKTKRENRDISEILSLLQRQTQQNEDIYLKLTSIEQRLNEYEVNQKLNGILRSTDHGIDAVPKEEKDLLTHQNWKIQQQLQQLQLAQMKSHLEERQLLRQFTLQQHLKIIQQQLED